MESTRMAFIFIISAFVFVLVAPFDAAAVVYNFKLRLPSAVRSDSYKRAQERSNWCWAACAEMALRSQGIVNISQAAVVASMRGIPVDTPGYVHEVARALTGIARDRVAGVVVSQAVVYTRMTDGKFYFNGSPMNGSALAFLLAHGIPAIALYNTGGNVGHYVLISGVTIDSDSPARVLKYQIEDPWPLDERGRRQTGSAGVHKEVDGSFIEEHGTAFIVPIIVADSNAGAMRRYLNNYKRVAANPRNFTFEDFVTMAESSATTVVSRSTLRPATFEVADFKKLGSLRHGDSVSKSRLIFGVPESIKHTKDLIHESFCDGNVSVSHDSETKKVEFIQIDAVCGNWVADKLNDSNLVNFLGKNSNFIQDHIRGGRFEDDSLRYDDGNSVELEFKCYDFNDFNCTEVTIHWYGRKQ